MGPMDGTTTPEAPAGRASLPSRGGEMAYLEMGPPDRPVDIVFSHANGYNGRTYRSILAPLAADFRILAVDFRGHGASTLPTVIEGREGWHEFRDDLAAFLAEVADRPVVLGGHSMGATSSLLVAAMEPERVKALGLFDAVLFDARLRMSEMTDNPLADGALRRRADFASKAAVVEAYRGRGGFRSWSDAQLIDYVEAGFRATAEGGVTLACRPEWEASSFRIHNYDPWAAFRAIRCPAVLLRAEHDSTARVEGQEAVLAAAGVRVETIPGTTHFLPMERPDLVRAVLRELAAG